MQKREMENREKTEFTQPPMNSEGQLAQNPNPRANENIPEDSRLPDAQDTAAPAQDVGTEVTDGEDG
ncbi:MAG TPA: hypothetical protein VHK91_13930 [Flavisolibacter sp.]|jgi:hypothetical protein|nr:hypothetical protein [Flavisolibacter sp.]